VKYHLIAFALFSGVAYAQPGQMTDLDAMFFEQFDADKNGMVTKSEFLTPTEAQFDHMDGDGNGMLDANEVKAFNAEMTQRLQEMQRQMQQQGMPRR
jgi:Ca2+-binding EF-hand superfamily protein